MSEITRFYGIIIKMYFTQREYDVLPQIQALYDEYTSAIDIRTLEVLERDLPNTALTLVKEWIEVYREDLLKMWIERKVMTLPPFVQ